MAEHADDVYVLQATRPEDREAAFRLRYAVYIQELKYPQRYANVEKTIIEDPFDASAILLVAKVGHCVVGTVRSNFGDRCSFGIFHELHKISQIALLDPKHVSMTSRLVVDRQYRSGRISLLLAQHIFQIGVAHGIKVDFIDCQKGLIPFYERLGYNLSFPEPFNHPELGPRYSLRLSTEAKNLREKKSPLLSEEVT